MNKEDRLAEIIAKGKWHYILVRGVLFWGLLSSVLVDVLTYFFKSGAGSWDFIRPFLILPPMGILWGAIMWTLLKKRFETGVLAEKK